MARIGKATARSLRSLVVILGAVALLAAGAFAALQTRIVKDRLAEAIAAALGNETTRVSIGRIDGRLPFDFAVAEITVADAGGPWLEVERLTVAAEPLALLRGVVHLERVAAAQVRVLRTPEGPAEEAEAAPIPTFESPVAVVIDEVEIARIVVDPPVAGFDAVLAARGRLGLDPASGTLGAAVEVERLDGVAGRLSLAADYRIAEAAFTARATIEEPPGGVLAGLLALPPETDVHVAADGDGTLDDWRGRIEARIGTLARADADIALAAEAPANRRFTIDAGGEVAGLAALYAPDLADLAGEGVAVSARGLWQADGVVRIDRLALTGADIEAEASGRVAPAFDAMAIDAELSINDLSRLSGIAGTPLAGAASVRARLDGALESLAVRDAEIGLRSFATSGVAFDRLDGTIDVAPQTTWADPALVIAFAGEGTVENLRIDGAEAEVTALLGARARWALAGSAPAADGRIVLDRVSVAGEGVEAEGDGAIADGRELELTLAARLPALARLAPIAGIEMAGSLSAEARTVIDLESGAVAGGWSGFVRGFSTTVPGLAETVGARAPVSGRVAVDEAGGVRLDDLELDGEGGRLSGNVALAAATEALTGTLRLDVADLARYRALVGADIAGRLAAAANLGGSADDPAIGLSFSFADLEVAGAPPLAGQGWLTGAGLADAPAGRLALSLAAEGVDLTAASDYALEEDRLLLRGLEARGPGIALEGNLSAPLDGGPLTGALTGSSDDLAPLAALADVAAGGAVSFDVSLSGDDGRQGFSAVVEARALALADAGLAFERLGIQADGTREQARLAVDAAGTAAGREVELAATAQVTVSGDRIGIVADRLNGSFAGQPLAFESPATASIAPGSIELAAPAVSLAGGRIALSLARAREALDVRLVAERLPLAAFAQGADGVIDAEATVTGAAPAPEGSLRLTIAELHVHDEVGESLPPVELAAKASWTGGVVDARATMSGFDGASLAADLRFPLVLSADGMPRLDTASPIEGTITGEADVARISPLFLSDLDRAAGRLDLALGVTGTFDQPEVTGRLALADGAYENGMSGTMITDLAVELAGDGREVVLRRFAGRDGGEGTVSGGGTVAIDPDAGFPHAMAFDLAGFTLVRREEGEVPVDGRLTLSGSVDALELVGELTVPRAELRIPDSLPPNVVTLEVVEVGGGISAPGEGDTEAPGAGDQAPALDLDVVIVMPGQVFVRGRGLTSEWRGRLAITGPAGAPLITGSLELVRGSFDLLGKTLDLRQGSVRFDDEVPNDPVIDALARADLDDAVARIEIAGRSSAPQVTLSSDPPLPEDEILSRLLFGSGVGELSALQAVQLADSLATLSGTGGGGGVLDSVRSALGADILELRAAGGDPTGGTLRAGKYLTEDVMLSVEQGTGPGSSKATLEVDVTDNISLETDVGADAQGSIGVNVKTDY